MPLCVHLMLSSGGTPKPMEQEICRVPPRGTSTRPIRSAVTSGETGEEGEQFGGREGRRGCDLINICSPQ